jgi:uncharacterized protein YjbI with pentapeptide repeats
MANQEQVDILRQGVDVWNKWKMRQFNTVFFNLGEADLRGANLQGAYLSEVSLQGAQLQEADLSNACLTGAHLYKANFRDAKLNGTALNGTNLSETDFRRADLRRADLRKADLRKADLRKADLSGPIGLYLDEPVGLGAGLSDANLCWANFSGANLQGVALRDAQLLEANFSGANLRGVDLRGAYLIETNLTNANLERCHIFGISAWNVHLEGAKQKDLVITDVNNSVITVDNLEVAQFIYLLLNNQKIRNVIDTITSKVVLILGRFTPERKPVLDALRDELRKHNFSPVVFDFDPSAKRNLTETISLLANMSRFVIADLTDAKSIPQELQAIVPHLPSVPIQPILHRDATEYAMFEHYERYPWVLPIYRYQDIPSLLSSFKEHILKSIEQKEHEKDKTRSLEEEVKNKNEKIRELEEKVRMLEQNK